MTLCRCVCSLYEKSIFTTANSLFTSVRKVQHCTGYLLIQVEIVSIYALYALAGLPKFFVDFLVPGVCGHSWTISSVGAGAGTGTGPSVGASSTISAISVFSSFLSEKYRIRHRRSIWCCHVDKVR